MEGIVVILSFLFCYLVVVYLITLFSNFVGYFRNAIKKALLERAIANVSNALAEERSDDFFFSFLHVCSSGETYWILSMYLE
jgi:hypothetical protein